MNLGKAIQHVRKSKNLTQHEFADILQIDQSYLSLIENNKKKPSYKLIERISDVTQYPVPIFFFLSLSEDDIPEGKREFFNLIYPNVKGMLSDIFQD